MINFLLGSSKTTLTSYRLARMGEAKNLRKEIQELLDKLREVDLLVQLSFWFEQNDREALKQALETEEGATDWARRMIRGGETSSLAYRWTQLKPRFTASNRP
jgi:hypothetical protein